MRELKNVTLEITTKCNFKCKHCCNNSGVIQNDSLSKEEILKIIDELKLLNVERLGITGGEPFCDDNLFEYLKYAKNKIPMVTIATNGYLISEKIVKELVKNNITKIAISLDGTKEYHDEFRGIPNAFERALYGIKLLIANNIEVKVRSVVTKSNQESILELMDITNTLKIKRHEILPACPIGRANEDLILTANEYKQFLLRALEKIRLLKPNITFQFKPVYYQEELFENVDIKCKEKSLDYKCDALDTSLEICSNGDIIPCSFVRIPIGNIREKSIKEIWNSEKAKIFHDEIFNNNLIGECGDCDHNKKCNGGCYANKLNNDYSEKKDIYCFVYRRK
jgi:AdoMet-dependent heme synthase